MTWSFYDLEVEWMDDRKETFHIGGYRGEGERVKDGVLNLHIKDGEMAATEHVASIPLAGVRKWGRKP